MAWAILVIWKGGEEEYLKAGRGLPSDPIATWRTRGPADFQADFMRMGMDDVQSINVVRAPREAVRQPASPRRATKNASSGAALTRASTPGASPGSGAEAVR